MKKITTILLIITLLLASCITAHATTNNETPVSRPDTPTTTEMAEGDSNGQDTQADDSFLDMLLELDKQQQEGVESNNESSTEGNTNSAQSTVTPTVTFTCNTVNKAKEITVSVVNTSTGQRLKILLPKSNNYTLTGRVPNGVYSIENVEADSPTIILNASGSFTIDSIQNTQTVEFSIQEKNASFAPLELLKNNAFILILLIIACVVLYVCKKNEITLTSSDE